MNGDRRKLLLDRLAAGQYNGIVRPTRQQREEAVYAFDELYREDEGFRRLVDENRRERERRQRSGEGPTRRWLRRLVARGRAT